MIELVKNSENHRDSIVKLLNNKNIEKWLLQVPHPYTYNDADFWLNKCGNEAVDGDSFSFAIENDGLHVGGIGLTKKNEHSAELGYWIGEEYWNRGFATKAIELILDKGFNEFQFARIHAHTFEGNIASEKLLMKCGFEYEGLLKKIHKKGDTFINSKLFAKVID